MAPSSGSPRGPPTYCRLHALHAEQLARREAKFEQLREEKQYTFRPELTKAASRVGAREGPAAAMLYRDAVDRRRYREIQLLQEAEASPRRAPVLPHSRKIYWSLLEKQVKTAYDECCGGEGLTFPMLECVLNKLRCLPVSNGGAPRSPEPALAKLQAELWRTLDPKQEGVVDLLTLTVFFHVLLGAVETPPSQGKPGNNGKSPEDAQPESNNAPLLQPISEHEEEAGHGPHPFPSGPSKAVVEELLRRFDAQQVRRDFSVLRTYRQHFYQSNLGKGGEEASATAASPQILPQSRLKARQHHERCSRQAELVGHTLETTRDRMMWEQSQWREKAERDRKMFDEEEAKQCPFRPNLSSTGNWRSGGGRVVVSSKLSKHEELYARAFVQRQKKEEQREQELSSREKQASQECTFKPDRKVSQKSYTQQRPASQTTEIQGFGAATERLRKAGEARARKQEELDRCAYTKTLRYDPPVRETKRVERQRSRSPEALISQRDPRDVDSGKDLEPPPEAWWGAMDSQDEDAAPDVSAEPEVLMYCDVNITPETTRRLVMYRHENPSDAAAAFAAEHGLSDALAAKLRGLLTAQVAQIRAGPGQTLPQIEETVEGGDVEDTAQPNLL
eukprot:CAMPEP_0204277442 /NCGR_PEP_ID=MMETSP0468-20130131/29301_1 /ASSEMBLY_ACC=CAM_ASM_000383 /TAXON_ID=2969 /ORGANISM="Oxyrrhis marina" /LENGTH=618 /DNA_ID=CAMNT_0051254217 /DNA_START=38 /DNA_END=1894 /DNA_ORIENTATION=-